MAVIAVIIPTIGRVEVVSRLVDSLLKQDNPSFEIILVTQQPDETRQLTERWPDEPVRVVQSPRIGTTAARNAGLAATQAFIVVFLDDDVEIDDQHFLSWHAAAYAEDARIGGVGGKILEDWQPPLGPEGQIASVSESGHVYASTASDIPQDITAPRGGNMSFRRAVIEKVSGFDERFVGNAMREETDFSLRVVKAGYRIRFEPRAVVRHLAHPSGGSRRANRRQWYEDFFANEVYFFKRHFSHRSFAVFLLRRARPILACMFYYGRGRPSWLLTPWRGIARGVRMAREAGQA
jgi:GT2 family glycosyltransferase